MTNNQNILDTKVLLENEFTWIRSSNAEPYYQHDHSSNSLIGTSKLTAIQNKFNDELVKRSENVKATKSQKFKFPARKPNIHLIKHCGKFLKWINIFHY